jgi:hypothetical protein
MVVSVSNLIEPHEYDFEPFQPCRIVLLGNGIEIHDRGDLTAFLGVLKDIFSIDFQHNIRWLKLMAFFSTETRKVLSWKQLSDQELVEVCGKVAADWDEDIRAWADLYSLMLRVLKQADLCLEDEPITSFRQTVAMLQDGWSRQNIRKIIAAVVKTYNLQIEIEIQQEQDEEF